MFPALPLLYMAAAVGLDKIMPSGSLLVPRVVGDVANNRGRDKDKDTVEHCGGLAAALPSSSSPSSSSSSSSWSRFLPRLVLWTCVGGLLLVSAVLSASFAFASALNYPGNCHIATKQSFVIFTPLFVSSCRCQIYVLDISITPLL